MGHVVLLGDSIFDNAAYVGGRPAVIDQVRGGLPEGWHASLIAVDGDTTRGVYGQLERLPGDASHLFLSVGGNDALGGAAILNARAGSVADAVSSSPTSGRASIAITRPARGHLRTRNPHRGLHGLQSALRRAGGAAGRRHRALPVQRRHHPRGPPVGVPRDRPPGHLHRRRGLRQSDRAIVNRWREDRQGHLRSRDGARFPTPAGRRPAGPRMTAALQESG
ncbi:MAG: hypothetical protein WKF75_20190 [Singulisphaera sp.]